MYAVRKGMPTLEIKWMRPSFMPTMLDLTGQDIPDHVQVRSFVSVLCGETKTLADIHVFNESEIEAVGVGTPRYNLAKQLGRAARSITRDGMRLWDAEQDPYEIDNLAAYDPADSAIVELEETLDSWHASVPWINIDQTVETS